MSVSTIVTLGFSISGGMQVGGTGFIPRVGYAAATAVVEVETQTPYMPRKQARTDYVPGTTLAMDAYSPGRVGDVDDYAPGTAAGDSPYDPRRQPRPSEYKPRRERD
jgi:hypothetical protein